MRLQIALLTIVGLVTLSLAGCAIQKGHRTNSSAMGLWAKYCPQCNCSQTICGTCGSGPNLCSCQSGPSCSGGCGRQIAKGAVSRIAKPVSCIAKPVSRIAKPAARIAKPALSVARNARPVERTKNLTKCLLCGRTACNCGNSRGERRLLDRIRSRYPGRVAPRLVGTPNLVQPQQHFSPAPATGDCGCQSGCSDCGSQVIGAPTTFPTMSAAPSAMPSDCACTEGSPIFVEETPYQYDTGLYDSGSYSEPTAMQDPGAIESTPQVPERPSIEAGSSQLLEGESAPEILPGDSSRNILNSEPIQAIAPSEVLDVTINDKVEEPVATSEVAVVERKEEPAREAPTAPVAPVATKEVEETTNEWGVSVSADLSNRIDIATNEKVYYYNKEDVDKVMKPETELAPTVPAPYHPEPTEQPVAKIAKAEPIVLKATPVDNHSFFNNMIARKPTPKVELTSSQKTINQLQDLALTEEFSPLPPQTKEITFESVPEVTLPKIRSLAGAVIIERTIERDVTTQSDTESVRVAKQSVPTIMASSKNKPVLRLRAYSRIDESVNRQSIGNIKTGSQTREYQNHTELLPATREVPSSNEFESGNDSILDFDMDEIDQQTEALPVQTPTLDIERIERMMNGMSELPTTGGTVDR